MTYDWNPLAFGFVLGFWTGVLLLIVAGALL